MTKYLIYLCGGMGKFGKEHFSESNEWRKDVKNRLKNACCNYDVVCINPNDYYSFLDDTTYESQKEIMEFDLHKLRHSNLVIINFNDPSSIGSACELAIAYERRIPVIGLCENGQVDELHPWLKEICNKFFSNREEMILYVLKYYLS